MSISLRKKGEAKILFVGGNSWRVEYVVRSIVRIAKEPRGILIELTGRTNQATTDGYLLSILGYYKCM